MDVFTVSTCYTIYCAEYLFIVMVIYVICEYQQTIITRLVVCFSGGYCLIVLIYHKKRAGNIVTLLLLINNDVLYIFTNSIYLYTFSVIQTVVVQIVRSTDCQASVAFEYLIQIQKCYTIQGFVLVEQERLITVLGFSLFFGMITTRFEPSIPHIMIPLLFMTHISKSLFIILKLLRLVWNQEKIGNSFVVTK